MSDQERPKIIVDEDWKSQVEKEREQLSKEPPESDQRTPEQRTPEPGAEQIPPASLAMLVTSIGTQALMALGQIADPETGKGIYHPELARHHIDTLSVLQEKTKGNLTAEEESMLEDFLFQLRQIFVATSKSPPPPAPAS